MGTQVLLLDSDRRFRVKAAAILATEGYEVTQVESLAEAIDRRDQGALAVLMVDPRTGAFEEGSALVPGPEVLLATVTRDQLDHAQALLAAGADGFVLKPLQIPRLAVTLRNCLEARRLKRQVEVLAELEDARCFERFLPGGGPLRRRSRELAERVAAAPRTSVLIAGAAGTGREETAYLIHRLTPGRSLNPFLSRSCQATPPAELTRQLFGEGAGAGLLERADGGTVFLDQIQCLSSVGQRLLLQLLDSARVAGAISHRRRSVDLRVIAATSSNLLDEVAAGRFREDLYQRLQVFRIDLPTLADSRSERLVLAESMVRRLGAELHKDLSGLTPQAEAMVLAYPFPHNLRELHNAIERAAILETSGSITPETLVLGHPDRTRLPASWAEEFVAESLASNRGVPGLRDMERLYLTRLLDLTGGNRSEVSRLMGVSYPTASKKIAAYKLAPRGRPGRLRS